MTRILKAIYPGTFDPITYGHLDIAERALKLVDHLIIGISASSKKKTTFTTAERLEIIQHEVKSLNTNSRKVEVVVFEGLLVTFAQEQKADMIIRGIRAVADFEYEFQMSSVNSTLLPNIETYFLPSSGNTQFISSRLVKEVVRLGGDVSKLVSEHVKEKLENHFRNNPNII
jgi:pantetheine-phosphate adenylyltransferase